MSLSHFELMQKTVDTIPSSTVEGERVACTIVKQLEDGTTLSYSATNFRPPVLVKHFGLSARIGNPEDGASNSAHSEFMAIIGAPFPTESADIYLTDPPCPNCVKLMAEAGIKNIYIDHKGFEKSYYKRRKEFFENMSIPMCESAGIGVHKIFRKEREIETLLEPKNGHFRAIDENPVTVVDIELKDVQPAFFENIILEKLKQVTGNPFAMGIAKNKNGDLTLFLAQRHPAIGFTTEDLPEKDVKYSFLMQPLNRLMMAAARLGHTLDPHHIFCSRVPTSREQVNFVAALFYKIIIGDIGYARDADSQTARQMLQKAGILDFQPL